MLSKQLEQLGLSKNEATVYLSLFGLERMRAGEIIKKTGLHRHLVYQALEELTKRHLVAKAQLEKVLVFQTTDPSHFLDAVLEQNTIAQNLVSTLKEREKITDQNIIIYENQKGVQTFSLRNAANLQVGETICVMASGGNKFEQLLGKAVIKKYFQTIENNGGKIKILMYEGQKYSEELMSFVNSLRSVEIRYLSTSQTLSANVVITKNSVGITILENPATVIEINNSHLVDAYLSYFDILWSQEIQVARGEQAVQAIYFKMLEELSPGETYEVLGANVGLKHEFGLENFYDIFHTKRIAKGVVVKMLSYESAFNEIKKRFIRCGDPEFKISHIQSINVGLPKPMQINLYHGKTFITLTDEKEPIILYSEKPNLFHGFKSYFDLLWNQNSWTYYGEAGLEEIRQKILDEKKDIYLIGANQSLKMFDQKFHQQRVKQQLRLRLILQDTEKAERLGVLPLTEVTQIKTPAENPLTIVIFGNHVAQIIWTEKPTIFLLNDQKAAEKQMIYFETIKKHS
ncbi:MAG: helix-turn-helix domain-containing protein [Candidatus Uhrbacteria bacterium]